MATVTARNFTRHEIMERTENNVVLGLTFEIEIRRGVQGEVHHGMSADVEEVFGETVLKTSLVLDGLQLDPIAEMEIQKQIERHYRGVAPTILS